MTLRAQQTGRDLLIRTFTVAGDGSFNDEDRSVDALIATEAITTVFDMRTWEPVDEILLLGGMEPTDQAPLVDSHPQQRAPDGAGGLISADVHGSGRQLTVRGSELHSRLFFADDEDSLKLWRKVRGRHVRDLSIGARPIEQFEIPPGGQGVVAGKTYTARAERRLFVTTRWRLSEISVTPRGADPQAKIRQATVAGPIHGESSMNQALRDYLVSIGMASDAADAAAQTFLSGLNDEQKVEADKLRAAPAVTPAPAATLAPPPAGNPNAETIRAEGMRAERQRVARIDELAGLAGGDVPADLIRQAVNDGWEEERVRSTFVERVRAARGQQASGPAIHSRSHEGDCTLRALQVGLMHRTGTRLIDPRASETVRAQQEREAEMGYRYRDVSMVDMCREACRLDRVQIPDTREDLIRTAISGGTLINLFSTNVGARMMQAFDETPDTTDGLCIENDVANFLKQERTSLGKSGTPKKLARGGTAKHSSGSDSKEEYKIGRFATQFVVDDQDFIDDNLGGITMNVYEIGQGMRRLKPDLFYAMLLLNPAMRDSKALFHADHNNLGTGGGSALGVASLQAGCTAMASQAQDGVQLNLAPKRLLVPQALDFTAAELLKSTERRDTTANTKFGTYNALRDKALEQRTDNRLGLTGVFDPDTEAQVAGSATNWFLVAEALAGKTAECGYLAGTGRKPSVRSFVLDKGQWGLGWDFKFDIGLKFLSWEGWYKANGA